jgi:hypothetical protein
MVVRRLPVLVVVTIRIVCTPREDRGGSPTDRRRRPRTRFTRRPSTYTATATMRTRPAVGSRKTSRRAFAHPVGPPRAPVSGAPPAGHDAVT